MFAPSARFVVCHICLMSPPMSNVPDVESDWDLAWASMVPIFANCWADADVSWADAAIVSPVDAEIIALTSAADLSITLRLKSLKSCNWFAVSDSKFSRDLIWFNLDEHAQRRYVSFWVAQN